MGSIGPDSQIQRLRLKVSSPILGLPLSREQTTLLLEHKLYPLLPYPLPLVRRIQSHLRQSSPSAQVWVAFVEASKPDSVASEEDALKTSTAWLEQPLTGPPSDTPPFIAAYIDLASAGQTQCWLFASWEIPEDHGLPFPDHLTPSPPANPVVQPASPGDASPTHRLLMRTLFNHIFTNLVPLRPDTPPEDWLWLRDNKKWLSLPFSRTKVLFGTVHSSLIPYFSTAGETRRDGMYRKYLFPPSTSEELANQESEQQIHHDYILGALRDEELQAVLDASPVPRTLGTLKGMVSVGAYSSGDTSKRNCVAWGFLSKDGSISSMLVGESHRGKGLAVLIARELLRQQATTFRTDTTKHGEKWWGHADVDETNGPSRKVMEKLGGKIWWGIQWVEIDVAVILEELDRNIQFD
jgi:hypothetical protein